MSDGSSGNGFGEALENMTTNTKQAIGGTIADFGKTAANQVKGNSGLSGSFTPTQALPQAPQPNEGKQGLTGGDLFSPDMTAGQKPQQQNQPMQPLTQAGKQAMQNQEAKSPEEMKHIQEIEQELRTMHQKYYQEFLAKAEGRDRKTVQDTQEKEEEKKEEKMEDLQKQEEKKKQDDALLRAQTASERKGGGIG